MKKFLLIILLSLGLINPVNASVPITASLTLNQVNPSFGQSINFTAIYPSEAAKQSRQPQYPNQPTTQLDCYQIILVNGQYQANHVYTFNQKINPKTKIRITGGWTGITYDFPLYSNGGNGYFWISGAAICSAALYSFDVNNQLYVWAVLNGIQVGP